MLTIPYKTFMANK